MGSWKPRPEGSGEDWGGATSCQAEQDRAINSQVSGPSIKVQVQWEVTIPGAWGTLPRSQRFLSSTHLSWPHLLCP